MRRMTSIFRMVVIVFLAGMVVSSTVSNAFAGEAEARAFVQKVLDKSLAVIRNGSLNDQQKEGQLEQLFQDVVDAKWIGRFAIGKYWRNASAEQQQQYLKLYSEYLVLSYVPKFRDYTDQQVTIQKVQSEKKDEYLVLTEIAQEGKPSIKVNYRIRQYQGGSFRVFDVIAEGVSLITTQRSDFASIISSDGVHALIEQLSAHIKEYRAKSKQG